MKTTTIWKGGETFDSVCRQSTIEINGAVGFSPKTLLLSGLAGCAGIDVVMILEKMRVLFSNLQIEAATEQTDELPKVFKDITLTFRLTTEEENRGKVQKAIELSLQKYCGVAAMLKKNSEIVYKIDIRPE